MQKLPLTPLQKGMLAYSLGAPGTGMYIVQPIIEFTNICISSIEFAIGLVVNRHEILRSSIEQETEDPHLITHDSVRITIEEYDWSDEESDFRRRIKLREFLKRDREKSFDFGEGTFAKANSYKGYRKLISANTLPPSSTS